MAKRLLTFLHAPAKTANFSTIYSAVPKNDSTLPNKFFPVQSKETAALTDKLSTMDMKGEAEQSAFAESSKFKEMNMLIQKQQTRIDALCRFVQLQSATIKDMDENQRKLQAELEKLTIEQQIMRQELNELKTKPQQAVSPRTSFF